HARGPRPRRRRRARRRLRSGCRHPRPDRGAGLMIRVVLAENHAIVRRGLVQLLESADDLEVADCASDGAEAVELVAQHDPDVVVMDLEMPVMDGVAATRAIVGSGARARVMVLTSFSDRARILDAL